MNAIFPRMESSPPSKPTPRSPLPANGSSLHVASFTLPSHRPMRHRAQRPTRPRIILQIKTQLTLILSPNVIPLTIQLATTPPTDGGPTAPRSPAAPVPVL